MSLPYPLNRISSNYENVETLRNIGVEVVLFAEGRRVVLRRLVLEK